jgi:hypothetical protein
MQFELEFEMRYDANDDYALFNLADMALPKGDHCG